MDTSSCGTPSHAAPEVLSQSRMTKQGDVYAFGIIGEAGRLDIWAGVNAY